MSKSNFYLLMGAMLILAGCAPQPLRFVDGKTVQPPCMVESTESYRYNVSEKFTDRIECRDGRIFESSSTDIGFRQIFP